MIPWYWLVPAVSLGAVFGVLVAVVAVRDLATPTPDYHP